MKKRDWLSASVSTALLTYGIFAGAPSRAAEITAQHTSAGTLVFFIQGQIVQGDSQKFSAIAAAYGDETGYVMLNSPGGQVVEGLAIGEQIYQKHYATIVDSNSPCFSTCALIWLAGGDKRYAGRQAKIGFHAAFNKDSGAESGAANALVGAYLEELKLPIPAIFWATSAPPNELAFLNPAVARKIGINYFVVNDELAQGPASDGSRTPPTGSPQEQRAKALVQNYYGTWSLPGDARALEPFYAANVWYYGATTPLAKIMVEKQKFSLRWPVRQYTVDPNTLYADCSANDLCAVSGVVRWDVASTERDAHATGSANFVLKIVPANTPIGGRIVSENGAVLANHKEPLSQTVPSSPAPAPPLQTMPIPVNPPSPTSSEQQQQPALTPPAGVTDTAAYAHGREARLRYTEWFGALLEGPYKDGANYWSANRSMKKPTATCDEPSAREEWRAGCLASRVFLMPVDTQRFADKNYWWGWNSL